MSLVGTENEKEAYYVGYTKLQGEDDRILWQRQEKPPVSADRLLELLSFSAEAVKGLPTEEKQLWFYLQVENFKAAVHRGNDLLSAEPVILLVERQHFLRDSFEQFRTTTGLDLRLDIKIHFLNEVCQDAGGLIREWFSVLIETLFASSFGLVVRTNTPDVSYVFNEHSAIHHANHNELIHFLGQAVAKALFERIPIKAYLSKLIYKQLLGQRVTADDMKYYDIEMWRMFRGMLTSPLSKDSYIGTFVRTAVDPVTGHTSCEELKQGGAEIEITEENKQEFSELYFQHTAVLPTAKQTEWFQNGFHSLVTPSMIAALDVDELELFICGHNTIDVADWKTHTQYKGVFTPQHEVILWLWAVLESLSDVEKETFLQFCIGSRRVPAEGFKGLRATNGKHSQFCIDSRTFTSPATSFIVAHTCFNRIEVPLYPDRASLEANLTTASCCLS